METFASASDSASKRGTRSRSNQFYGCLVVFLFILLLAICGVFVWLLSGSPISIYPPSTPSYTPTASSTATITSSPTVTFTPTPSATRTNTPTSTASVTPFPTRTATKAPTHTSTITNTPGPTKTPTRTPKPTITPTPGPVILKNVSYRFTYQGWTGFYHTKAYKNGMRCNSVKGRVITYTTPEKSRKVGILFYKGPGQGKARILIDDKLKETIDLYSQSGEFQFERTYNWLSNSKHTVKIIVLRKKDPNSAGYAVCVDGFLYNKTRVNDTYRSVAYGPWSTRNTPAIQNTFRVASSKNARLSFRFKGTAFIWVTATGPRNGLADIYVDNKFIRTVDLYTLFPTWQRQIRVGGLSNKTHTVTIVVLGQKHPASKGTQVFLDRIIIP